MNKANRFIEKFWLVFTIAAFIYAVYAVLAVDGWPKGAVNFVIPAISFCWWFFRRFMRLRMEKHQNQ
jgi:membrane protein implicated in regulation of membrane protease activity